MRTHGSLKIVKSTESNSLVIDLCYYSANGHLIRLEDYHYSDRPEELEDYDIFNIDAIRRAILDMSELDWNELYIKVHSGNATLNGVTFKSKNEFLDFIFDLSEIIEVQITTI